MVLVENGTNTTVTFSGTVATTTGAFSSTQGDEITIDGTSLTVDYSSELEVYHRLQPQQEVHH